MKVSIIMTVFKRAPQLALTLPNIKRCMLPGDEIVCIDDGPYDGVDKFLSRSGVDYQYYRTENEHYRNGAQAKNIGLKKAKNDIIFIHEAEIYGIDWAMRGKTYMQQMRDHFTEDQRSFVVAGNVKFFNPDGITYQSHMTNNQAPYFAGVRRQDLMDVTGWDERFIYWGNEDNDLMHRLGKISVTVAIDPDIYINHIWHERPPRKALGNYNEPLLYEPDKPIQINQNKPWGILPNEQS